MAGLREMRLSEEIRRHDSDFRTLRLAFALLLVVLPLPATSALVAGPAVKIPQSGSTSLSFEIQRDLFIALRNFRREQLAQTVYSVQLRLNPRQVYIFRTRSKAEAEKHFKAALRGLHQIGRRSDGIPGFLRAEVLANYAWFIYPNNKPIFIFQLGAVDRDRVAHLLKQAVSADPRYPFAWICLCSLDRLNLLADRGTPQYAAALAQYDHDTRQALKLAPRSPNALFLRAEYLDASDAAPDRICHLFYLASKNLAEFSLRAVRYEVWAYDGICQMATIYLRDHKGCPDAASAIKLLPPFMPLPPGIVVRQDHRRGNTKR